MTTTKFLAHPNDRQATKLDLLDICRALGIAMGEDAALDSIRGKLANALTVATGYGQKFFGTYGRQVSKNELLDYALALGVDANAAMNVPRIRALIRAALERRAEQAEQETKQAASVRLADAGRALARDLGALAERAREHETVTKPDKVQLSNEIQDAYHYALAACPRGARTFATDDGKVTHETTFAGRGEPRGRQALLMAAYKAADAELLARAAVTNIEAGKGVAARARKLAASIYRQARLLGIDAYTGEFLPHWWCTSCSDRRQAEGCDGLCTKCYAEGSEDQTLNRAALVPLMVTEHETVLLAQALDYECAALEQQATDPTQALIRAHLLRVAGEKRALRAKLAEFCAVHEWDAAEEALSGREEDA